MNTRNDWQNLLKIANSDLKDYGYELNVFDYGDGYYICEILKDGMSEEVYAENFYENELSDLITEAWHYVKANKC